MTLRKRKAAAAASAATPEDDGDERAPVRKRTRATRASQRAKEAAAARMEEEAAPEPEAEDAEEESASLLFASAPPVPPLRPAAPTLDLLTQAINRELINGSPMLQAIELALGLDDSGDRHHAEPLDAASRRSTRARRKPAAPGPLSLLSTPLSTLSSPTSPPLSPPPATADAVVVRSSSCGSSTSTVVSDYGYPSEEGTVVDEAASPDVKMKRKAIEMDDAEDVAAPHAPAPAKGRARKPAGGRAAPARKRAKTGSEAPAEHPAAAADLHPHGVGASVAEDGAGDGVSEEMPAASAPAAVPAAKKRKTAASGGRRRAARRA